MEKFFGIAAGIVGIIGYAPYIRDILAGQTKPERASWLIWSLEYGALFFAQLAKGATDSLWLVGLQMLGMTAVFILSVRYGAGGFSKGKIALLLCVCAALVSWYLASDPTIALFILIAIEASGVVLTVKKVYKDPGSETLVMWALIGTAGLLGIPSVGAGSAAILYLYPVALIFMNYAVVIASWMGTRKAAQQLRLAEE